MKLSDLELQTCPRRLKSYKIFDGNGLYAEVPPTGNIRWRAKFVYQGKEKRLSLGVYPEVTLTEARLRSEKLRAQVREGIDPSSTRRMLAFRVELSKGTVTPNFNGGLIAEIRNDIANLLADMRGLHHSRAVELLG